MLNKLRTKLAAWLLKGTFESVVVNITGNPIWFIDAARVDGSKLPGTVVLVETSPGQVVKDCIAVYGVVV